ncbi:sigma-54-dependent Fis family transcriptional regulator [Pseudonocardia xishanensis]|uniref:Helix-turn-helix domain-containing protein n=1 Tax=Pseudonocardia xishanensis TaxID=630995 RepID=A0ABP8RQU5_9PSEU
MTVSTWERFQSGDDHVDLRPDVLSSWRRSRWNGVDPEHVDVPFTDADPDTRLARIAVPILARMAELLTGDGSCLALSDERGAVLWRWVSEPALRTTLDDLRVSEGFCFDEEFIGTNGLGTALETGRIALVRGSEHFVQRFHHVTCVAAPIRHPVTRRTVGAVNVTCRAEHTNPLLAVVVRTLVEEIQSALWRAASARERVLLDAFLTARRRGLGPVAIVGEDVLITDAAAAALDLDHRDLWDEVRDLSGDDATVQLADRLHARVEVLRDGGTTTGALLTLADPTAPRARGTTTPDPWTTAAERVAALVGREVVAVRGEPGVGKLTLLRELWPDAVVLDAATLPVDGLRAWVGGLRDALAGPGAVDPTRADPTRADPTPPVLLTHVELVDTPAARAIAAELDRAPSPPPLALTLALPDDTPPPEPAALLLDRLGAAVVSVPPLRSRPDAVAAFAQEHLRDRHLALAVDALTALRRHPWPGNLRELTRVVRDAGRRARGGVVQATDLPTEVAAAAGRRNLTPLEHAESTVIAAALHEHRGNKSAVAKELGISRTALYSKLRAYRL